MCRLVLSSYSLCKYVAQMKTLLRVMLPQGQQFLGSVFCCTTFADTTQEKKFHLVDALKTSWAARKDRCLSFVTGRVEDKCLCLFDRTQKTWIYTDQAWPHNLICHVICLIWCGLETALTEEWIPWDPWGCIITKMLEEEILFKFYSVGLTCSYLENSCFVSCKSLGGIFIDWMWLSSTSQRFLIRFGYGEFGDQIPDLTLIVVHLKPFSNDFESITNWPLSNPAKYLCLTPFFFASNSSTLKTKCLFVAWYIPSVFCTSSVRSPVSPGQCIVHIYM